MIPRLNIRHRDKDKILKTKDTDPKNRYRDTKKRLANGQWPLHPKINKIQGFLKSSEERCKVSLAIGSLL